ncbi:MAG TPA: DUF3383 domain-containing protein [Thermomonas sp.]|nr:DUF3383 domain-containing protein [Thermomonas sp.]
MQSIPASAIVSVVPSVLSAGGRALDLNGLCLTTSIRTPIGAVQSFASSASVASYFGSSSAEAAAAAVYFGGFDGGTMRPGALLFAQYPAVAVGGFLRGASVATLTLAQLQALTGTLSITVNGVVKTSSTITLSGASSFSNAATIIAAAFTSPGFAVSYDSVSGGFLFLNATTGVTGTMTYATGSLATSLALTLATGAVLSQGAAAATPAAFMSGVVTQSTNWATFFTLFDPDSSGNSLKQAFASWNDGQGNRWLYACWDTDAAPKASSSATSSLGYLLTQANSSGTVLISAPDAIKAAFVAGYVASLDFTRLNGRATLAFRSQQGLAADVVDQTTAENLIANGYNYYGTYATANDQFTFMYPGSISGEFKWADSYVNQIWLNNALQLAMMTLLTGARSVPYNDAGYAMIDAACADPILAGLNFGAIRPGVALSALQISQINDAAGKKIDDIVSTRGWYFQVQPATAITRGARATPPLTLWYADGGSVQKLNLASIEVQ